MDMQSSEVVEKRTKLMATGEVTPDFLKEWLQKTNSFYIDDDDGLPRSVLNYGTDYDGKNIMFYTTENEPNDNSLICDTIISYPSGDWGENVYRELGNRLERNFHIDIKSEYMKNQHKDFREIDGDMAVSMCEHGFNVFKNGLDKKISSLDEFDFDTDNNIYYSLAVEVEQENALCSIVDRLDKLNDLARYEARETESILTSISLEDYATELYEDGDCEYKWRDERSEWQNIADSILSGDTEYIHTWLNDLSDNLPYFEENQGVSIDEHRDALTQYEKAYHPNIDDLSRKVNAEYDAFIDDMKKQSPEIIIDAAYEITWKDSINLFVANEDVLLSHKQLQALLSSPNTLDEIFEQWIHNGELHTYSDIQIALDDTANNILTALDRSIVLPKENNEHHEKAVALVNGEIKELPVLFDNQGANITSEFLEETINTVTTYHIQTQEERNDPLLQDGYEFEDLPSTDLITHLPPLEVEKEIHFNSVTNRFEMSQAAFEWLKEYAPKHNEMSALESQLLAHIRAADKISEYDLADTYRWSSATCLDEAADFKSEWMRNFAKEHSISLSSDITAENEISEKSVEEKPRKLSLSERIDKARAEKPQAEFSQQDKQQLKKQTQEL